MSTGKRSFFPKNSCSQYHAVPGSLRARFCRLLPLALSHHACAHPSPANRALATRPHAHHALHTAAHCPELTLQVRCGGGGGVPLLRQALLQLPPLPLQLQHLRSTGSKGAGYLNSGQSPQHRSTSLVSTAQAQIPGRSAANQGCLLQPSWPFHLRLGAAELGSQGLSLAPQGLQLPQGQAQVGGQAPGGSLDLQEPEGICAADKLQVATGDTT